MPLPHQHAAAFSSASTPALDARCWPASLGRSVGHRHGGGGVGLRLRHGLPFSTTPGGEDAGEGAGAGAGADEDEDEPFDERSAKQAEREARRNKREARKEDKAKAAAAVEIDAYNTDFLLVSE